ncbi:defensin-like protein 1 [Olea europaea var. sylvestris]|uniref:defensin-like protein 1 n=1 Tax=Olea europaea var. sylvestris TaxID=158386 RepID=UPI000C1D7404|nr:defensin-like protein 1 [Olea europaea var. sylvestris]XP_022842069.1 defensin-like protein 1 [Olea europaea var. sylvestris]
MAKSQISKVIFSALLICFLLIASNEVQIVEAKVCSRLSRTWSGICLNTGNCDRQCRNWEKAQHGACHRRGWGFACFCYRKC